MEDSCGHGSEFLHSVPLEKFVTGSVNIKFPGEHSVPCNWLSFKEGTARKI